MTTIMAPSMTKALHRPPALLLEQYNQSFPTQPDVSEGASKGRQGHKPPQRFKFQDLLPSSLTASSAGTHTNEPPSSNTPIKCDRKHKQPRSASLPSSIRWDKSPRRRNAQGKGPAKAATTDSVPPGATSTIGTGGNYNVKGLKVRLLTWNMHDSLPKGELEELLGKVLPYGPNPANPPGTFPILPDEPDHPYHFVVVAGQECPSLSGLPMALGAGFKLKEKDKDREKEKEKDKDRPASFEKDAERSVTPQNRPKEGGKSPDSAFSDVFLVKPTVKKSPIPNPGELPRTPSPELLHVTIPQGPPAGWSSIVEDWLCNGGIFELPKGPKTPKIVEVVSNVVTGTAPGTPRLALKRAPSIKEPKKGPYQFLVKERLMGIYLAIYVHRDLKPLIKGTSKSAVTAGLIGGRVGNKGGVGISVNVDGTTILFLNAHLAAHEGRVNHRLANLAKIKAELEVDDFLPEDDPRKSSEDLTDRFDFTFLCGDLNFRLDITRLHADWLISRKDYAQALAFDQLLKVMKEDAKEFKGFNEAPINFAPTFKYDVLRTLKRHKRAENDDDDFDPDGDAGSISSVSTTCSRTTDLEFNNVSLQGSPSPPPTAATSSSSKVSLPHTGAAHKAKTRLLPFKQPLFSALPTPDKSSKKQIGTAESEGFPTPFAQPSPASTVMNHFPPTPKLASLLATMPSTPPGHFVNIDATLVPPPKIRVESMKSGSGSQENLDGEKGVYDTSHKKRVPSWCDRILWKTTVEPTLPPSPSSDGELRTFLSPPPPQSAGAFFRLFRTKSAKATSSRPPRLTHTLQNSNANLSYLPPLKTAPPLSQTMFLRSPEERGNRAPDNKSLLNGPSSASATQGKLQRRAVTGTTIPPPSAPMERAHRRSGFGVLISPLSGGNHNGESGSTPSRWRFLPNFLSPNSHPTDNAVEEQVTPVRTPAIVHRRGDVICLDYDTLDNRQMRRLEGRSDHRPVLGTFVMYI